MTLELTTPRLKIVAGTLDLNRFAAAQAWGQLAAVLKAKVHDFPPPLMDKAFSYFFKVTDNKPEICVWWNWFIILSGKTPQVIGCAGFKGPPDIEKGQVEIGYSILPAFQKQGFATEAVQALLHWAQTQGAKTVMAETLPTLPASVRVMEKCGLSKVAPASKPDVIRYGRSL